MKRALIRVRMGYRKWKRYINSPAAPDTKSASLQYILMVAVAAAIVVKFKGQIEDYFYKDNSYYRYYDRVEPDNRSHPYIEN